MVNKVISGYLKTNKRVIVPRFGAFIHKDDTGIVFVPFLKKDDGVLVSLVAEQCSVSQSGAQQLIERFISSINEGIESNGIYVIEGLGALKKDATDTIILDLSVTEPPIMQGTELPVVRPRPVTSPAVSPKPQQSRPVAIQQPRKNPQPRKPVVKGNRPTQPQPPTKEDKADKFMMIAIIAAVIALAAIIYGVVSSNHIGNVNEIVLPVQDTVTAVE